MNNQKTYPSHVARELPVFPLPGTVIFPGVVIPLHVQETRYRDMIKDVLEVDGLLSAVMIKPGQEHSRHPELCDVGCLGKLIHAERLPSGRYNILLEGTDRCRLLQEVHKRSSYRSFHIAAIEAPSHDAILEARSEMASFQSCVVNLQACVETHDEQLAAMLRSTADPLRLADILGAVLVNDHLRQQELLATTSLKQRLLQLIDVIAEAMIKFGHPPVYSRTN